MDHSSAFEKVLRSVLITLVLIFFLFPIFWIFLMSLQTNETILRIPPSIIFDPSFDNYRALITGKLQTTAGNLDIAFMRNLWNSVLLSTFRWPCPCCWAYLRLTRLPDSNSGWVKT